MEALLNTWSKLDELNKHIESRLRTNEFNSIINDELNYNSSLSAQLIQDALNENKENFAVATSSLPSFPSLSLQQHQQPPKLAEKLLFALKLTESDLDEIELELEKAQVYLESLRNQLLTLFRIAASGSNSNAITSNLEKQVPIYNSLLLTMDKFKFELNYLRTNLNEQNAAVKQNENNFRQDENRLHIDLDGNQITYKSNLSSHHHRHDDPDMMTNIHLDFHVNF